MNCAEQLLHTDPCQLDFLCAGQNSFLLFILFTESLSSSIERKFLYWSWLLWMQRTGTHSILVKDDKVDQAIGVRYSWTRGSDNVRNPSLSSPNSSFLLIFLRWFYFFIRIWLVAPQAVAGIVTSISRLSFCLSPH